MATAPLSVEQRLARVERRFDGVIKERDSAFRALEIANRGVLVEIVRAIAPSGEKREEILSKLSRRAGNLARRNLRGSQFITSLIRDLQPRRRVSRPQADA